ncbi:LysM peptidoglycan-binding domain-containing protein [Actinoplanes regularis]|uniref:LysM peptidoglycan-binding domain-containing protein n=1 Tax=Actinoplanes regularis TaxID=52697 RepID=UPI002556C193|nr:LysM peptidoglycan-binding domain-containing protein [Actinoplanes regularis]
MAGAVQPSRAGRLLTGLGALAVVALIGALPFLLFWAAGNPLAGISDWLAAVSNDPGAAVGDLWQALFSRDDGDLFLQVLALVGWIAAALATWGWATFLYSFLVELVVQARARRHGRIARHTTPIRGMRLQQRAAAALAAAIIGALAAPTLASASVTMPPAIGQPAAAAGHHAAPTTSAAMTRPATAAPASTSTASGYIEHEVQRGQALLDIAEQYGIPLENLTAANYGLPQPDGQSLNPGTLRVYPGWVLRVPVSYAPAAAHQSSTPRSDRLVYVVTRNDRLSAIAERFLGDPDRYPEIARANPQLERRDHRFPDHIEREWKIQLPAGAHDHGSREHARGTVVHPRHQGQKPAAPGTGTPSGQSRPDDNTPAPTTTAPATAAPNPSASATAAPSPTASQTTTASSAPASPTASRTPGGSPAASAPQQSASADEPAGAPSDETSDEAGQVATTGALAGAGILIALLLSAVYRRRRTQRQHRRPGRRLPHPARGATEQVMRAAEQPADVDRLDAALRNLATGLAGRADHELPDIAGAWITTGHGTGGNQHAKPVVSLILTRPCPNPPAPWIAEGTEWTLPADADPGEPADHLAPLPTLVTIGSQPGQHLLLDLERLGQVTIVGNSDNTTALLRYLITELACNRWSDDAEITIAGFGRDEAELLAALNPDRIQAITAVTTATSRLRRRCAAVTTALQAAAVGDTLAGRLTDIGEAWAPQILLAADPADQDRAELDELGQQLTTVGRCAVATVVATTTLGTPASGGHRLTLLDNGVLQVTLADGGAPFLAATIRSAALPRTELEPLAEIMIQARSTADEPVPAASEPEPWAQGTDAAGSLLPHHLFAAEPDPRPQESEADPAPPEQQEQQEQQEQIIPGVEPSVPAGDPITSAVPISDLQPPRRETAAVPRQRRQPVDPDLDADLRAWHEQDPTRPLISILGPVTVTAPGTEPDRRRFYAEIVVLLSGRGARGITGDQVSEALWPEQQISQSSRRVAMARVRRWLGETPHGELWLPDMGSDRLYRLTPGYLLDWHLFRRARARGESQGADGIRYLRAALELVQGVPFDGADRAYAVGARNPYAWLPESDLYPGHIVSAVVDTAHRLAQLYLDIADYTNARWAAQQAWAADPDRGDDGPWQDLMRVEHAEGNLAELRNLVGELMRAREAEYPEDLAPSTYTWLRTLVPDLLSTGTFAG